MDKKNQPKKVFFLGAGFSKAINTSYPLLNTVVEKSGYATKGLTQLTLDGIINSHHYNSSLKNHLTELPESLLDNIEELLTFLNTDFPWKDQIQKKQDEALYEALTREVAKTIRNIGKNPDYPSLIQNETKNIDATKLIQYINENKYPVITLNYDTLFEELTLSNYKSKNGKINYSDLYQIPIIDLENRLGQGYLSDWNDDVIKCSHLLKLHGSVNWYFSKMSNSLYYEHNLPQNLQYLKDDLAPYIIPPVLDKNSLYNHQLIKLQWQKAHDYIKDAEEIYIIGFSLPQTDISVKFLFQSALKNSTAKTYLINVSKKEALANNFYNLYAVKSPKMYTDNLRLNLINYSYCGMDYPLEKFINEKILDSQEITL